MLYFPNAIAPDCVFIRAALDAESKSVGTVDVAAIDFNNHGDSR
jgi:hypothetical protein